jgi:CheY-like chemotaxis protein
LAVRVIVADDSTTVQKVLRLILTPQGYEVQCFSSGTEAFEAIKKNRPAVIFADAVMPGMNGIELGIKLQKGQKELQDVPLVLMHSAFDEISSDDIKASGAKAKLVKPFDDQQVVDLVEKLSVKDYKEEVRTETTSAWNMDSFTEPEMPDFDDPLKTVKATNENFDIDLTLAEPKATDEEGFIKVSETEKIDELGVPEPHELSALRETPPPFQTPGPQVQQPLSEETLSEHEAKKLFEEFNLAENPDGSIKFRGDNKVAAPTTVDVEKDMGLWSDRFFGSAEDVNIPDISSLSGVTEELGTANMTFEKAYSTEGTVDDQELQKITRETVERMLQKILPDIAEKIVREEISKIIGK